MQKITEQRVNPQPSLPPLSCYRGEDEYGPDFPGWYYQAAETTGALAYSEPHLHNDPNAPGRVGEVYRDGIITQVHTRNKDGVVYWVIYTETDKASVDLQEIKDRVFWANETAKHKAFWASASAETKCEYDDDITLELLTSLVDDIYGLLAVVEGGAVVKKGNKLCAR